MNKEQRKRDAQYILGITRDGSYECNGEVIQIPKCGKSTYYKFDELKNLSDVSINKKSINNQNIEFMPVSTVDAILTSSSKHKDIGVLNFASAFSPGGGFINGAMAQEESLCYASNLYDQLKDSKMYRDNKRWAAPNGLLNDSMIISDAVFFRNGKNEFVRKPAKVKVITSAACNVSHIMRDGDYDLLQKVGAVMTHRMEEIIKMFIRENCKTVILGAFGCGVFGNDTAFIANTWKTLLEQYGGHFDTVIFAILDNKNRVNSGVYGDGNFNIFKKAFE